MHRHFVGIFIAAIASFSEFKVFIGKSIVEDRQTSVSREKGRAETFCTF